MVAATAAGIPGIGVTTGPCGSAELTEAGATYLLGDLTAFPTLLGRIAVGSAEVGG
jgi:phosphoglycolate phosphatase